MIHSQAKIFVRFDYIDDMVRDRALSARTRLISADIHIPIDLAAIGAYYLYGKVLSKVQSKLTFSYSSGTNNSNHWLLTTSFSFDFSGLLNNTHEFFSFEAGSANQGTIDFWMGNKLSNVSTGNTAAIKDA